MDTTKPLAEVGSSEGLGGCDEKLRRAVKTVLEGWTLPTDARKILEAAVWATPQRAERVDLRGLLGAMTDDRDRLARRVAHLEGLLAAQPQDNRREASG